MFFSFFNASSRLKILKSTLKMLTSVYYFDLVKKVLLFNILIIVSVVDKAHVYFVEKGSAQFNLDQVILNIRIRSFLGLEQIEQKPPWKTTWQKNQSFIFDSIHYISSFCLCLIRNFWSSCLKSVDLDIDLSVRISLVCHPPSLAAQFIRERGQHSLLQLWRVVAVLVTGNVTEPPVLKVKGKCLQIY